MKTAEEQVIRNEQDTHLLVSYLEVCNAAIEENRDRLPYKPLILLYEKAFRDRDVHIEIYERDADHIESSAVVRLIGDTFTLVSSPHADPWVSLKLKRSYMQNVIANREEYILRPELLDWEWIKSRLGASVSG